MESTRLCLRQAAASLVVAILFPAGIAEACRSFKIIGLSCIPCWLEKLLTAEWVTAFATLALAVIGGITAQYAYSQLKEFRTEARIKHMIDLVNQFESNPLAQYRRDLAQKRLSSDGVLKPLDLDNPPAELYDIMNFFEHMGYLLDGNYLNLEDVSVEFHYWVLSVWADACELVKLEQADDSIYYEHFGRMVNRLLEYDRPRTGRLELPSASDIEDFYSVETHLSPGSPMPRKRRRKRRRRQGLLSQSSTPPSEGE